MFSVKILNFKQEKKMIMCMESRIQEERKYRNYSLDLLKLIAAFMIVCIHFKSYGKIGEVITIFARFAVPVFFMISGYYAYNDDTKKIKGKIIHIIKIYIFAFVIYFCFNVVVKILAGQIREAIWYVSTYRRPRYVLPVILFNESNTAMHLWFLGSLIYSYIIQQIIIKLKIKENLVYILSCALLLIHLALGIGLSVLGIETPAFLAKNYMLRNFLFMGFPLFSLGQFVKKNEEMLLNKVSVLHIVILFAVSIIEAIVMRGVNWEKDLYLGAVLFGFALFVVALKMRDKTYSPKLITLFNTSTNVYLVHVMIGDILALTPLDNMLFYQYAAPFIIFVVSVIITLVLNRFMFKCLKH